MKDEIKNVSNTKMVIIISLALTLVFQILMLNSESRWEHRIKAKMEALERIIGSSSSTNAALVARGSMFIDFKTDEEQDLQDLGNIIIRGPGSFMSGSKEYITYSIIRIASFIIFLISLVKYLSERKSIS